MNATLAVGMSPTPKGAMAAAGGALKSAYTYMTRQTKSSDVDTGRSTGESMESGFAIVLGGTDGIGLGGTANGIGQGG